MQGTERLFEHIGGVHVAWTTVTAATGELRGDERLFVSNAAPKRVREFSAGRRLARHVFRQFGEEAVAIPADADRLPVWPTGYSGSISHTTDRAAVAIGQSGHYAGIGLDIELELSLGRELVESVLTDDERERYPPESLDPTVLFSCKEAVYKAVYPRFREFLEFHDVEIDFRGVDFFANCRPKKASARWIANGRGTICHAANHIVTMFLI